MSVALKAWGTLSVPRNELNLPVTLHCGQSFRWKETPSPPGHDYEWTGVIRNCIVTLKQTDDAVLHHFFPSKSEEEAKAILEDYFQLKITPLTTLYTKWGQPNHSLNRQFKMCASGLTGVRLIRQDPLECLYSFICSSNNNIGRITKMVDTLCSNYGTLIGDIGGKKYYSFPTVVQLSSAREDDLREAGFGYRAKFIVHTTQQLQENTPGWLEALRGAPREEAQTKLMTLMGVGQKVADCVSLFSLDKLDIVPVDTHIWKVAQKHMSSLNGKSLSTKLYKDVGDFFRQQFGPLAGWAHTVLFAAELPVFQKMIVNMPKLDQLPATPKTGENKENEVLHTIPLSKRRRTKNNKQMKL